MANWEVKKGNTSIQDILIKDKDGTAVTNLGSATEIKFEIKKTKTSAAIITKAAGSGITVDTPSTGYLRVTLLPTDTDINPATYYMGLQITWSATEIYEVILKDANSAETDGFVIIQDIVNV